MALQHGALAVPQVDGGSSFSKAFLIVRRVVQHRLTIIFHAGANGRWGGDGREIGVLDHAGLDLRHIGTVGSSNQYAPIADGRRTLRSRNGMSNSPSTSSPCWRWAWQRTP